MSSRGGSLAELVEQAPGRSVRQVVGAVALWTAVGATAAVAVALALVVGPVREGPAAAPRSSAGRDAIVLAMAAAVEPAVAAREAQSHPPPSAQTAAVQREAEPQPAARQSAAHAARHHRRTAARGYTGPFQPFGRAFAWSSPRNRSR
jgi:hypothetical protein